MYDVVQNKKGLWTDYKQRNWNKMKNFKNKFYKGAQQVASEASLINHYHHKTFKAFTETW